jgi:protein-disulfide isomerase
MNHNAKSVNHVKEHRMRSLLKSSIFCTLLIAGCTSLRCQDKTASVGRQFASVDGVTITETQVRMDAAGDLDEIELEKLKSKAVFARNEQEILQRSVEHLIEERLLQIEAAKRGITKEELLKAEVQSGVKEPTTEEIDSFYEANAQRINRPKEDVASQIGMFLKRQRENARKEALLKRLEKEHPVKRNLEPIRFNVDAPGRPVLGPDSAPVTIVVFSDFQCPYCKSFGPVLKQVSQRYEGKVRLIFRQFPLSAIHPNAQKAAEASLCAANQNHFWEMHDALFQNQKALTIADLKGKAEKLGLDMAAFGTCLDSTRSAATVHEDIVAGFAAGADGTPSTFINGRFLGGSRGFEDLAAIIDDELTRKNNSASDTR